MIKFTLIICATVASSVSLSAQTETAKAVRLENAVNSEFTDAGPVFSPDGKTLFFKRKSDKNNYEIYKANLNEKGDVLNSSAITELNTKSSEQVEFVYPDGSLLISGDYFGEKGFYKAKTIQGKYKVTEMLSFGGKHETFYENAITFSPDMKVAIVSNNKKLYVSFKNNENENSVFSPYGELVEISGLNTSEYQYTPFLSADGKTLYFSANYNKGENDVFMVTRLDDTWLNWSEPKALDKTVNSDSWESYYTEHPNGDKYFYSLRAGDGDIYRIKSNKLPVPNPEDVVSIKNTIQQIQIKDIKNIDDVAVTKPEPKKPVVKTTRTIKNVATNNTIEANVYPNPSNGFYTLEIKNSTELTNIGTLIIYDLLGNLVESKQINANLVSIDLSNQPNGVYLASIVIGNTSISKRLVKE